MSVRCVDVGLNNSGSLHNLPLVKHEYGKFLSIRLSNQRNPLEVHSNQIQPSSIALNSDGSKLFCTFRNGAIYSIDFTHNRYHLLADVRQSVTAVAVQSTYGHLYIGLSDKTCRILDSDSGKECGTLLGHSTCIVAISIQPVRANYAVTMGVNEAILWNLATREKRCKLAPQTNSTLSSVFFLGPHGEQLLSCFRDGTLYVWDTRSLECCFRLNSSDSTHIIYRAFATTSDGLFLFAAGNSPRIHLWRLTTAMDDLSAEDGANGGVAISDSNLLDMPSHGRGLQEVIQLPEKISSTKRLSWIPGTSIRGLVNETDDEKDPQLNGLLACLGSDHRLRLLARHSPQTTQRLTTMTNKSKDPSNSASTIRWHCLLTIGFGSGEDPLIGNFVIPEPGLWTLTCENREDLPIAPATLDHLALIDLQGYVHVHSLSAAIKQLRLPHAPIIKVDSGSITAGSLSNRSISSRLGQQKANNPRTTQSSRIRAIPMQSARSQNSRVPDRAVKGLTDGTGGLLDRRRLRLLLKEFGHFPDKYRLFIWRAILQLPSNIDAFNTLTKKGLHPAYEALPERYPIRGRKLMSLLQRVCSALSFWCPLFGETEWLPSFVFPFIKLFQNNMMHAFEVVASILTNWCATWFEYFPNPPINILCMIENLVAYSDPELYNHLVQCHVTTEVYAWPLLQTGLSELFTQDEWLHLWDSILCSTPGLLIAIIASYVICARGPLLAVHNSDMFDTFFHGQNAVSVNRVVERAHQLLTSCPPDLHPDHLLNSLLQSSPKGQQIPPSRSSALIPFRPLSAPDYPIVARYPKFIVDFHIRERERIREEEKEYLRQRATAEDMQRRAQLMATEEQNWYRQQELLLDAEDGRRVLIAEDESKLREQRKKLTALLREVKLHELQLAEESRGRLRQLDLRRRKTDMDKMEETLQHLANRRVDEMDAATHAADLSRLQEALQKRRAETMAMMFRETSQPEVAMGHVNSALDDVHNNPKHVAEVESSAKMTFPFTSTKLAQQMFSTNEVVTGIHNVERLVSMPDTVREEECELDGRRRMSLAELTAENKTLLTEVEQLLNRLEPFKSMKTKKIFSFISSTTVEEGT